MNIHNDSNFIIRLSSPLFSYPFKFSLFLYSIIYANHNPSTLPTIDKIMPTKHFLLKTELFIILFIPNRINIMPAIQAQDESKNARIITKIPPKRIASGSSFLLNLYTPYSNQKLFRKWLYFFAVDFNPVIFVNGC